MSINLKKTIHITPTPDGYSQEEINEKLSEKLDVAPDGVNDLIGSDDKINPIYLSGGGSSDATSIYYDGNLLEDVTLDEDTLIITNSQVGSVSSSNPDLIVEYIGAEGIQSDTYEFVATASTAQYSLDLSANGTMGGSTKAAACSTNEGGHDAYMAFDNSSSTTWGPSNANPNEWVTLYDPAGIQIKTVSWLNGSYSEIFPITLIQGSNDNSEFTTIYTYDLGQDPVTDLEVDADTAYKYIRFYFPQPGNYGKFTLTSMVVDTISWSLGGETVDLADYGITCSGEVSTGDTITLVLEDGSVLSANTDITQVEADIEDLNEAVFPIEAHFNGTLEGSCTDNNGVLSNFSGSSYGKGSALIDVTDGSPWEWQIAFTTGNDVTTRQNIQMTTTQSMLIEISQNGYGNMMAWGSSNGASWDVLAWNDLSGADANTYYKVKFTYDGNGSYQVLQWYDNQWNSKGSSSGKSPLGFTFYPCCTPSYFLGTIDANNTYFKIGDTVVWNGTETSINKNNTTFYTKSQTVSSSNALTALLPITSTDYGNITPDSTTLYIITDTGAIYLGSTLIAQKNAS